MSRRAVWLGVCAVGVAVNRRAEAHAKLLSASPAVGSSISVVPDQLSLLFSEDLEPIFSTIHVTNEAGLRVDLDDLHLDPQKSGRLVIGLQRLPPGVYRVEWKVSAADTHKSQGNFTFNVVMT